MSGYTTFPSPLGALGPAAQATALKAGVLVTGGPLLSMFTVTGTVRLVQLYGLVTTAIGAVATSIRLVAVVAGTDTNISSSTAITSVVLNTILLAPLNGTGLRTGAPKGCVLAAASAFIVPSCTLAVEVVSGGTTGAVDWYCTWQPMTAGATLVAV